MKTLEYREQIIHRPPCYIRDNRQVMFVPNAHKIKRKWDEENVVRAHYCKYENSWKMVLRYYAESLS